MKDLSEQHTVKPFNWWPFAGVIKGKGTCDNWGCYLSATLAFTEGNAVWVCCNECRPDGITVLVELKPNANSASEVKPNAKLSGERSESA